MFPGNATLNQVERILEVTGSPTPEDIESLKYVDSSRWFASSPIHVILHLPACTLAAPAAFLIARCPHTEQLPLCPHNAGFH